jgi:hypothetical protein
MLGTEIFDIFSQPGSRCVYVEALKKQKIPDCSVSRDIDGHAGRGCLYLAFLVNAIDFEIFNLI